ncbi:MAG: tetratricopeptide repeat protein [Crocinitomicaceae bacterium]
MKKITLILLLLLSQIVYSSDFLDREYYLVDSLSEFDLSATQKLNVDAALEQYHASDDPLAKLEVLSKVLDELDGNSFLYKYARVMLSSSYFKMFSKNIEENDRHEYFRYFSMGLNRLGEEQIDKGNLLKSLDYFFTCIDFIKDFAEPQDYINIYTNIGRCYFHQGNLEQSEKYLKLAYECSFNSDDLAQKAIVINNLAVIYQEQGDLELSLKYHFESLDLSESIKNLEAAAMSYNNIGGIYCQNYSDSIDKGVHYLSKALKTFKNLSNNTWTALTYVKLSKAYLYGNHVEDAEINANFALLYASKSQAVQPVLRAYKTLYEVKNEIDKPSEALEYYQKYVHVRDSIYNSSISVEASEKELEYQYKTEKEISEKEHEKILAISNAKANKQKVINYGIMVIVLIVVVFIFIQKRRIKQIKEQKAIIERQSDERKILLKEIHHRVKNNFQIVCSVLRLQSYEENNPVIDKAFEDAINRIQSMAEVHELIYKEESFANINPQIYFERLTNSITHFSYEKKIRYVIDAKIESLKMEEMIALGIATNELITNSIKHAFDDSKESPTVKITLDYDGDEVMFVYRDNGEGFDAQSQATSFGTELIETVIDQIDGKVSYNENNKGVFATIRFKS